MSNHHVPHNIQATLTPHVPNPSDIHGTKSVLVKTLSTCDAHCNKRSIGTNKLIYLHLMHAQWSLKTATHQMTENIIWHKRHHQRGRRPPSMQRRHQPRPCVRYAQSSLNDRDKRKHRWKSCEGCSHNRCTDTCRHASMDAVLFSTNQEFVSSSASLRLFIEYVSKQHSNLRVCSWLFLGLCGEVCFIRRSW